MAGTFLNLSDDDQEDSQEPKIGAGLKRKKKSGKVSMMKLNLVSSEKKEIRRSLNFALGFSI